jgi:hypothetical protein
LEFLKGYALTAAAWASGGNLGTARRNLLGGAGFKQLL